MLTDVHILPGYETQKNDIANEFYNVVLSQAVTYDRISGYFSSKSLAYFSKGIESLINNYGHYRLIVSNEISKEDYDAIIAGYKSRELKESVIQNMRDKITSLSDTRNLANLAYLISINLVDIKIGFTTDGIFHAKYGIISDVKNNSIYFSGSFNETANAFAHNYENIDVKKSWSDPVTNEYIIEHKKTFNELWNGRNTDGMLFVKEVNEMIKKEIVKYNKGRIIIEDVLLTPDSLVLYIVHGQLHMQDNTNILLSNTRKLRRIKEDYLVDGELWNFKKGIGYRLIRDDLIVKLKKLAERENIKLVIADSVDKFIKDSQFKIEQFANQGINIKNKSNQYKEALKRFKDVLDVEISRPLRDVQLWVSFYMAIMKKTGNFSVPGAGKTAMVYGTYAYLSAPQIDKIDKIVVIGPKSAFLAWKEEFKEIFQKKRELCVLDVQANDFRVESFYKNVNQYNLILVNYESLKKYSHELMKILNKRTLLVFDEVHKLKSTKGERPKYAQALADLVIYKIVLTGTPIPNGYNDIYNMLHFLYKDEYEDYFGFTVDELKKVDTTTAHKINEKLNPFFWRVTKEDLNVPPVEQDKIFKIKASGIEQKILNLLWRKYGHQPFKLYIRLIQLASNPELILDDINESQFISRGEEKDELEKKSLVFEYTSKMKDTPEYTTQELELINSLKTSSKFEAAVKKTIELIKQGSIPIVWAIFINSINKFSKRLQEKGYRVAKIYGETLPNEREKIIKDFQKGKYDLLISNPHTLAESVSLHHISHDAIYLEYSFNLTHMLQSRDRIHRLGLPEGTQTNYYYFELVGNVEERQPIDELIYDRLNKKRELMIQAVEGNILTPEFTENEYEEIENLMLEFMNEQN